MRLRQMNCVGGLKNIRPRRRSLIHYLKALARFNCDHDQMYDGVVDGIKFCGTEGNLHYALYSEKYSLIFECDESRDILEVREAKYVSKRTRENIDEYFRSRIVVLRAA